MYNQNIIVLISGHDYQAPLVKHASQKDYATGFGGKYGVQKGSFDQSALGWDHIEKVDKHDSQVRFFYQIDYLNHLTQILSLESLKSDLSHLLN